MILISPFASIINPYPATTFFSCVTLRFFSSFVQTFPFPLLLSYPFIPVVFEVNSLFIIKSQLTSLLSPLLLFFTHLTRFSSFSSSILISTPLLLVLIATYLQIPPDFFLTSRSIYFLFTLVLFYLGLRSVRLRAVLNFLTLVWFIPLFSLIQTFLSGFISPLIHFSFSSFRTSPRASCYHLHNSTATFFPFLLSLRFISLFSIF